MAKYTIEYACGHGSHTEQLVGKEADRQRKIEWMKKEMVCPDCYKVKKAAENQAAGLILNISLDPIRALVILDFSGDTMTHKEAIKAQGFGWGELPAAGIADYLSSKGPRKAWWMAIEIDPLAGDNSSRQVKKQLATLKAALPITKLVDKVGPLEWEMLSRQLADKKAEAEKAAARLEKIAALAKPSRPAWMAAADGSRRFWNGKVYGTEKYGRRVYLEGKEVKMTTEEAAELDAYLAALTVYNTKVAEVKNAG